MTMYRRAPWSCCPSSIWAVPSTPPAERPWLQRASLLSSTCPLHAPISSRGSFSTCSSLWRTAWPLTSGPASPQPSPSSVKFLELSLIFSLIQGKSPASAHHLVVLLTNNVNRWLESSLVLHELKMLNYPQNSGINSVGLCLICIFTTKCLSLLTELIRTPDTPLSSCFRHLVPLTDSVKQSGGRVLVHCQAGISRSATICLAYLMHTQRVKLDEAFDFVKQRRQVISPNLAFLGQLLQFETDVLCRGWESGNSWAAANVHSLALLWRSTRGRAGVIGSTKVLLLRRRAFQHTLQAVGDGFGQ